MSKKEKQTIDLTKQAIIHANNELNKQLEFLSKEAGKVYSETVVRYWRILRKKNIFLSKTSMQKLVRNDELQSHTVQGIIDIFYDNIASSIQARKANPKARFPHRRRYHFIVVYKLDAIHYSVGDPLRGKNGYLELSNGTKTVKEEYKKKPTIPDFGKNVGCLQKLSKDGKPLKYLSKDDIPKITRVKNPPLKIPWKFVDTNGSPEIPKHIKISFKQEKYYVNGIYEITPAVCNNTGYVGVDLGDIHLAVAHIIQDQPIAEKKEDQTMIAGVTIIANGRQIRSMRNRQNKKKAEFQETLSKLTKGSRKWQSVNNAKKKVLNKVSNQIKDGLHQSTTEFVVALYNNGAKTVGIGDMRTLRNNVDKGKHLNQKIHQMPTGKVRSMLEYKCKQRGMQTELVNEAWSSQTCPRCLERHKPTNRNYVCPACGLEFHRDGVGAINICSKTWSGHKLLERAGDDTKPISMYQRFIPAIASGGAVVGVMAPPVGIRYKNSFVSPPMQLRSGHSTLGVLRTPAL